MASALQAAEATRVEPVGQEDEALWAGRPAWLGWRWLDAFQTFAGSVSIYYDHTREGALEGRPTRLRLVARQLDRRAGQSDQIRWTDSDRCPALMDRVQAFQVLEPPRTVIPALTWPPAFPRMVRDGVGWSLWSQTAQQAGGFSAYSEFSSNAGPIAEWGRSARQALKDCWQEDAPVAATR